MSPSDLKDGDVLASSESESVGLAMPDSYAGWQTHWLYYIT
jgi:hypothetical protein